MVAALVLMVFTIGWSAMFLARIVELPACAGRVRNSSVPPPRPARDPPRCTSSQQVLLG